MPFTFMVQQDYVAGQGRQIAAVFGFVTNFFEWQQVVVTKQHSASLPSYRFGLEVHYYALGTFSMVLG